MLIFSSLPFPCTFPYTLINVSPQAEGEGRERKRERQNRGGRGGGSRCFWYADAQKVRHAQLAETRKLLSYWQDARERRVGGDARATVYITIRTRPVIPIRGLEISICMSVHTADRRNNSLRSHCAKLTNFAPELSWRSLPDPLKWVLTDCLRSDSPANQVKEIFIGSRDLHFK